jgi:hypothetical protein
MSEAERDEIKDENHALEDEEQDEADYEEIEEESGDTESD